MSEQAEFDPREQEALRFEALETVRTKAKDLAEILVNLGAQESPSEIEDYLLQVDPDLELLGHDLDVGSVLNEAVTTTPFITDDQNMPVNIRQAHEIIVNHSFISDPRFGSLTDEWPILFDGLVQYRALNKLSQIALEFYDEEDEVALQTTRSIVDYAVYSDSEIPDGWVEAVGPNYISIVRGLKDATDMGMLDQDLMEVMVESGVDLDDLPRPDLNSMGSDELSHKRAGTSKIFGIYDKPDKLINMLLAKNT